jgi:hypothetical protein
MNAMVKERTQLTAERDQERLLRQHDSEAVGPWKADVLRRAEKAEAERDAALAACRAALALFDDQQNERQMKLCIYCEPERTKKAQEAGTTGAGCESCLFAHSRPVLDQFRAVTSGQPGVDYREKYEAAVKIARDACRAAIDWRGLDGDGISQPVLNQLRSAVGLEPLE